MIADLFAVADTGVEAFRAAWKALPPAKRALVPDMMEAFKERAEKADAAEEAE